MLQHVLLYVLRDVNTTVLNDMVHAVVSNFEELEKLEYIDHVSRIT